MIKNQYGIYPKWTIKESKLLQEYYPIASDEKLRLLFPNRTLIAIKRRANILDINRKKLKNQYGFFAKWTKEEDKILTRNYKDMPKKDIKNILKNRTWSAIKTRAQYFKLKREHPKENLENKWIYKETPTLFYVLGVLYGDGYPVTPHGIGLQVTDKIFAEKFYYALNKIGLLPTQIRKKARDNGKPIYRVAAYSRNFFEWFKSTDLEYIENKLDDEIYVNKFLEGFYESEGNFYNSKKRRGAMLRITNTNKEVLSLIKRLFTKYGYHPAIYKQKKYKKTHKQCYSLQLGRTSEVREVLTNKINCCIARRQWHEAKL